LKLDPSVPIRIPAAGLLSGRAIQLLSGLGVSLPEEIKEKVLRIEPTVHLQCRLEERSGEEGERDQRADGMHGGILAR
jgi:hypothetical protein